MSRPIAEHELSRILALVPWIVAHPARPKTEVAERFGISVAQLESDLDLVLMIGVPPYSPRSTSTSTPRATRSRSGSPTTSVDRCGSTRPRVSPCSQPDGRCSQCPVPTRGGPLATALEKLEAALELPDLVVAIDAPEHLDAVRAAAEHDERLEIDYWSAGRDELTTRRIDPTTVFFALGEWYVDAWCHRAGDHRLFRVDRIRAVRPTGERFEARRIDARPRRRLPAAGRRPAGDIAPAGVGRVGRGELPGRDGRGDERRAAAGAARGE